MYPFAMMMPGDMFETDGQNMAQIAKNWNKNHTLKWQWITRDLGDGRTGVWRKE